MRSRSHCMHRLRTLRRPSLAVIVPSVYFTMRYLEKLSSRWIYAAVWFPARGLAAAAHP
jgi:hypothetical protein